MILCWQRHTQSLPVGHWQTQTSSLCSPYRVYQRDIRDRITLPPRDSYRRTAINYIRAILSAHPAHPHSFFSGFFHRWHSRFFCRRLNRLCCPWRSRCGRCRLRLLAAAECESHNCQSYQHCEDYLPHARILSKSVSKHTSGQFSTVLTTLRLQL